MMKSRRGCIFIVGFMASGKSTIGKHLASRLGLPFIDTDEVIEKQEGMPVRDIFARKGEGYFRSQESALLQNLVGTCSRERCVIAAGGGMPCSEENLGVMKGCGILIYLEAGVDDIISRIQNSAERPVFRRLEQSGSMRESIAGLLKKREHFYRQADLIVDNRNGQPPGKAVSEIIHALSTKKIHEGGV